MRPSWLDVDLPATTRALLALALLTVIIPGPARAQDAETPVEPGAEEAITPGRQLFEIPAEYAAPLDEGRFTPELRQLFVENGVRVSREATITVNEPGERWSIEDSRDRVTFRTIVREGDVLQVYEGPSIESQFSNYLHFSLIGRFELADQQFGAPLVRRPELEPPMSEAAADRLVMLSDKHKDSIEALQKIIKQTDVREEIRDTAQQLLNLIHEAHKLKRQDPDRIKKSIELLRGTPVQREVGLRRLVESGEYAVPWMLAVLTNPDREELHPFVIEALPALGRNAINPLLAALGLDDDATLAIIVSTLGKLGYPQALPYLQRLASDETESAPVRKAAAEAIHQIAPDNPLLRKTPAPVLFHQLAEQYYQDDDSLRPDPRERYANVWVLRDDIRPGLDPVEPIEVPQDIYHLVKCMDTSEASLALSPDSPELVALWLAANFRREARLGLDVESEETVDASALDATRPEAFPRSIYFARGVGPGPCQIALTRGIRDRDTPVALGAVAALAVTAGPSTLVEPVRPNGSSLAEALFFPDLLVRLRAALALGRAMPDPDFRGSAEVIPVLASALSAEAETNYLLVEPDEAAREALAAELRTAGARVIAGEQLGPALDRARAELTHLDGVFLASDIERPGVIEAIRQLGQDERFALAPVVVLVKDALIMNQLEPMGDQIGTLLPPLDPDSRKMMVDAALVESMLARKDRLAGRLAQRELTPEQRLALALEVVETLRMLAESEAETFNLELAEPALIRTLREHDSQELRVRCAEVLARLDSGAAQQALAEIALGGQEDESLRKAAFGALATSARRFGSRLRDDTSRELRDQAFEQPNLELRTAASKTLGALGLPPQRAADIILSQGKRSGE